MIWDEWRGSLDGKPTLWIKRLIHIGDFRIDLHKIVGDDDWDCFHTHPHWAFRLILKGGYIEQLEDGEYKWWEPGNFGLVAPELSHRLELPANGIPSYSLWIRFPTKKHKIELRGSGWEKQIETER